MRIDTIKSLLFVFILLSILNAEETTLTNITFKMDDSGNLNPSLLIPMYYGSNNQYYSAIGYTSSNYKDINSLSGFNDSKNALVSSSNEFLINYLTYKSSLFGTDVSIGIESVYTKQENNEFGYIHDNNNIFENGSDYYISFDNTIELDIYRHAIRADIIIPLGKYFTSRAFISLSPYTTLNVKQTTIFKPLVDGTGTSNSSTLQDIAYNFRYELQSKTNSFMDIGFLLSYDSLPLKYEIAQLAYDGSSFIFENTTIDTIEVSTKYLVKFIVNRKMLGGLRPSFGYGVEYLDVKNNLNGDTSSTDITLFSFGVEKRF